MKTKAEDASEIQTNVVEYIIMLHIMWAILLENMYIRMLKITLIGHVKLTIQFTVSTQTM